MPDSGQPTRIAILGGGMGALASAFELVTRHRGPEPLAITVYERDHRLGGKGASGRRMDEGYGERIEEHGLHVLMGFYENVFEVLKTCYDDLRGSGELPPANGPVWWSGVLHELDTIYFAEPMNDPDRPWLMWEVPFPTLGDPIGGPAKPLPPISKLVFRLSKWFLAFASRDDRLKTNDVPAIVRFRDLDERLVRFDAKGALNQLLDDAIVAITEAAFELRTSGHQWFSMLYFAAVNLRAIIADVLSDEKTFIERLDEKDYKEWIRGHAFLLTEKEDIDRYLVESPLVNAVYDLVFSRSAAPNGPKSGFAAGTALYDTLIMLFYYRDHIFYKMAGGMGDVVFAPLYLYLQKRGVRFEFFHDVQGFDVTGDHTIDAVHFDVTRTAKGSAYDPLVHVACRDYEGEQVTIPCWPSASLEDRLEPKPAKPTARTLRRGTDFDYVVLGIAVGAFAEPASGGGADPLCKNLFVDRRFEAMSKGLVTRGTRAVQLWLTCDLKGLGWPPAMHDIAPPRELAHGPVLGSYAPEAKLNSWADMSQVICRETWPGDEVKNIVYLCDVFDEVGLAAPSDQVHDEAVHWLEHEARGLWSGKTGPFPWESLAVPANVGTKEGPSRFDFQYWRANDKGSERYVTGAPGTTKLRLRPGESTFRNLVLAGDWVRTELNAGCVEGATMGGREAGRVLLERIRARRPRRIRAEERRALGSARTSAHATHRPPFAHRDGDLPLVQPIAMHGVEMQGYVHFAPLGALDAMLDAAFQTTGIDVSAVAPFVLITPAKIARIFSADREANGYMDELEVAFFVPVRYRTPDGDTKLAWYLPYLFVDNPAALQAGREIHGFNKAFARFAGKFFDGSTSGPFVEIEAQVIPKLGTHSKLSFRPVVTLDDDFEVADDDGDDDLSEILKKALALVDDEFEADLRALLLPELPLIFLKQFRSEHDPETASYSAFVVATATVESVVRAGLILPKLGMKTTLPSYDTMRIGETLGLGTSTRPLFGFHVTFDATVATTAIDETGD